MPKERYLRERAYRDRKRNRMDYGYDYPEYNSRYDYRDDYRRADYERDRMDYERPREPIRDYTYDMRFYRRDYADYDYEKDYHKDLEEWTDKLKKFDRFNLSREQVIANAKQMGVKFDEYSEDEFYTIYLMHISDYPSVANEPHTYLAMTKAWLEDKDLHIDGSEKVCKYMYEIVMADD